MSRREVAQRPEDLEAQLVSLIPQDKDAKDREKEVKKEVDELGPQIKEAMRSLDKTEFVVGEVRASITVQERSSFNELQAIEILRKKLTPEQFAKCVKTREYIDDEAFEKMAYAHEVDPAILQPANTPAEPTVTLRLGKVKK